MIEPRLYAKINFDFIKEKLIILPEDKLKISFMTNNYSNQAVMIQPDIYSPSLPSPLRERYHVSNPVNPDEYDVQIPCDNMKVADTLVCDDYFVYCTSPDDMITL